MISLFRRPARSARVALVAVFALLPAMAAAGSATLDRIKSTGTIRLAYREAAAPFSFKEGDRIRGYAVELCERVAESIRASLGLATLGVVCPSPPPPGRIEAVARGDVDAECGTTTITLGRMEQVDFSVPYFVDGGSVVVRSSAKLARLADLKGKRIAVLPATTTERALAAHLSATGATATLVPVRDVNEGVAALAAGRVDAVAGDRIVLVLAVQRHAAGKPSAFAFVSDDFSYEPYAVVVPRNDPDFRLAVNRALVGVYRSGEIDGIFQRWFGTLGPPGPLLHAMFYLQRFQD